MVERNYDDTIAEHYRKVADSEGLSAASTMLDEVIRARETAAVETFVTWVAGELGRDVGFVDVGCGNGFTLEVLAAGFPLHTFTGFELTPELLALARERLTKLENAEVHAGDIRDPEFTRGRRFDVLLSQRVLINLLDPDDQRAALDHLVSCVHPGGFLLFIEAFSSPMVHLNAAREELDLEPITPAHHNLYLGDDFFEHPGIAGVPGELWGVPENDISTHYYVSRVLAPWSRQGKPFKRNSEFQRFFSAALPPAIGDYSPLRIVAFRREA